MLYDEFKQTGSAIDLRHSDADRHGEDLYFNILRNYVMRQKGFVYLTAKGESMVLMSYFVSQLESDGLVRFAGACYNREGTRKILRLEVQNAVQSI